MEHAFGRLIDNPHIYKARMFASAVTSIGTQVIACCLHAAQCQIPRLSNKRRSYRVVNMLCWFISELDGISKTWRPKRWIESRLFVQCQRLGIHYSTTILFFSFQRTFLLKRASEHSTELMIVGINKALAQRRCTHENSRSKK